MKYQKTAVSLIIAGITSMTTSYPIAETMIIDQEHRTITAAQVPTPKLERTIDLSDVGPVVAVKQLTFSPDSRYLAIVVYPELGKTDIVVWDMKQGRRQSHFRCGQYFDSLNTYLLWSHDGKVISFGVKRQWNPMTGEALPDNPAIGSNARLNKDGTKMLTIVNVSGDIPYIRVYDTATWEFKNPEMNGLWVKTAAWTAEDKLLVGVGQGRMLGKNLDGRIIGHEDVGIRLIDPSGKDETKAIWFPGIPDSRQNHLPWEQTTSVDLITSNFVTNKVALSINKIIDGRTLEIITYYSTQDVTEKAVFTGSGGISFDPSGRFLYLKDSGWFDNRRPIKNSIIDVQTGELLTHFNGGTVGGGSDGISISSDGNYLAIGDEKTVQILKLNK